ncbi:putative protein WVD2-like 7 [Dioscorea sansibarensis]
MQGVDGDREVSTALAFGGSVSFGRFMSESLDWGRWSSFGHNRYLEEVERYARPGSVAQKKAFFEAHYKKMAALKIAGSLEESVDKISENQEESVDMAAGLTDVITGNKCEELKVMPNDERPNLVDENGGLEGDHEVDENQSPEEKEDVDKISENQEESVDMAAGLTDVITGNKCEELKVMPNDERPNLVDENGGLEGDHEEDENQSPEEKEDVSFTVSASVIQSSCSVEDIGNQINISEVTPLKVFFCLACSVRRLMFLDCYSVLVSIIVIRFILSGNFCR